MLRFSTSLTQWIQLLLLFLVADQVEGRGGRRGGTDGRWMWGTCIESTSSSSALLELPLRPSSCITFQNGPYLVLERCLIPWLNNWNSQTICQFKHVNLHVCFTCPDTHINERNHLCKKHVDGQKRVVVVDFKAKKRQGLNEFLPLPGKEVGGVSVVNIQPTWQQKMWSAREKVRRQKRLLRMDTDSVSVRKSLCHRVPDALLYV